MRWACDIWMSWIVCLQGTKKKMENLLSLSKYIDVMRKLTALATGVKGISYFIATDDAEAEKMMRSSFEDGTVSQSPFSWACRHCLNLVPLNFHPQRPTMRAFSSECHNTLAATNGVQIVDWLCSYMGLNEQLWHHAGLVFNFPKTAWSRSTVAGIQQALVDVLLLSECPVLIGTYYSSYSETAKLIGWPYYIQVTSEILPCS